MPITLKFKADYFMPVQSAFIQSPALQTMYVGGQGSGKSFAFQHKAMLQYLGRKGKANIQIGYPTYDMGKRTFVKDFTKLLQKRKIRFAYNKSDHTFESKYGFLKLITLDNPDAIIADNLTDVGIDELDALDYADAKQVYYNFLGRLRGCKDPQLFITTSPEGFRFTHELANSGNVSVFTASTRNNDRLPNKDAFINARIEAFGNNPLLIAQYIDGEFVNVRAGRAYYAFNRAQNSVLDTAMGSPIYIGMDFNVNPMTAVIGRFEAGVLTIVNELWLTDSNTFAMGEKIRSLYGNSLVNIFPDSTANSRKTSASQTDISILKGFGFNVYNRSANPLQIDRVNVVNRALVDGFGKVSLKIDSRCKHLIEDLEQVTWRENGDRRLDDSNHQRTHISDALGYLAVGLFGLMQQPASPASGTGVKFQTTMMTGGIR